MVKKLMMRTAFLVDGFNLYHSTVQANRDLGGRSTTWLDIDAMCRHFLHMIGPHVQFEKVHYFSALAFHLEQSSPATVARHRDYIRCLESTGVEVVLSRFKEKRIRCSNCGQYIIRHEEKETDVAIAVKLLELFVEDICDMAVLVTGDTDLAPAARAAQQLFPTKEVRFAFPHRRKNRELQQLAPGSFKIQAKVYANHQFSAHVTLPDGTRISKPSNW